eukprot:1098690-Pelagomonas_calceolata.AAC.2
MGRHVSTFLRAGAKREMNRSEKLASINSKRFIVASTAYGFMLFLACRYGEAETIIRQVAPGSHLVFEFPLVSGLSSQSNASTQVLRVIDRAPSKEISDKEQAVTIYHLASILKEQASFAAAAAIAFFFRP